MKKDKSIIKNKFWNEKNIVSLLTIIVIAFFMVYIGPYDGLSKNYNCQKPDKPQAIRVESGQSYEEEVVFEKKHLSAIEVYVEDGQLTDADEVEILIGGGIKKS